MRKVSFAKRVAVLAMAGVALLLVIAGVFGMAMRTGAQAQETLTAMRLAATLRITGKGALEAYVNASKKEASDRARAEKKTMAELREAVNRAEAEARASMQFEEVDISSIDAGPVTLAIDALIQARRAYAAEEAAAQAAYLAQVAPTATEAPPTDLPEGDLIEALPGEITMEEPDTLSMLTGFRATPEMLRLQADVDARYADLTQALSSVYPGLTPDVFTMFRPAVTSLVYAHGDTYESVYDRMVASGGSGLSGTEAARAAVTRYGDDLVYLGVALAVAALAVLYSKPLVKKLGPPRIIIGAFFLLLCLVALLYDINLQALLGNTLVRVGMNGVLVLAMVPAIKSGISLNLGLPIGVIAGLLGGLLCIEYRLTGWVGFAFAVAAGSAIAAVFGYLYGLLLNRLKGSEMAVTTYVGLSFVSLMCIAWLVLPFQSLELRWPMGGGLRNSLSTATTFRRLLDDFLSFNVLGMKVPTGLLLFLGLCAYLVWLFFRSKTGVAMQAAGSNPRFAQAAGINVDKMRIIGTVLSTILGAVGIIVYNQSFGFIQLYNAPRAMGFIAASAILIGGASTSRASISNVLVGSFLFFGVLTLGMPVANTLLPQSMISETIRILISNGIILYALTKSGGASRA
ncbi:MAG TPA: hypothetical protein VLA21_11460 [Candidatus Limnocylindria bacterium]|nr:hypothetical protein [Candidatus Limnocylindria bacterium]